jgi:CDP-diacylglycerol--serine O-phosphatidyltransferase
MDFRKTYFILPNLFTLSSVLCGFYSIILSGRLDDTAPGDDALYKAALAILLGLFFDGADGRIARLTRTQSDLGMQLDSLADVITFGVAPALMIYRWGLEDFGRWGIFVAFVFVACGALRLARFNVLAMRDAGDKPGKYMIGLPIPIAANVLVGLVLVNHGLGFHRGVSQTSIAVLVCVLGYLMISRIRFRSLKDIKLNRRTMFVGLALAAVSVFVTVRINAPAVLLGLIGLFILMGLCEEVVLFRRRRREERGAAKVNEPDDREEDVLAELGANDEEEENVAAAAAAAAAARTYEAEEASQPTLR